jgi:flavodoxin
MRSLVLCYSRTAKTKKVATALAESLGADLTEIRCGRSATCKVSTHTLHSVTIRY